MITALDFKNAQARVSSFAERVCYPNLTTFDYTLPICDRLFAFNPKL
jgi:hypothetical protein